MTAVIGGLFAAVAWAATTMCYSRASKTLPSASVIALAMLVGFVVTAPAALIAGIPDDLDGGTVGLLLLAGAANLGGLLLVVTALRAGQVSIVAPIVSTEGAIAAVLAILAGEAISPGAGVTLALVAAGIALASAGTTEEEVVEPTTPRHPRRAVALAIIAALSFGVSLYATGQVSDELAIPWALLPARVIGVVVLAVPLLFARRLVVTREALPFVVLAGIGEVVGFAAFTLGARDAIAISAVLASQFGVLAAVAAYALFGERLSRLQTAGVAAIAVGVAALTLIQA